MKDPTSPALLSVVIPAFNEAERISDHLERIAAYAATRPWDAEVLVVDDASTDRTPEIVLEAGRRWPQIELLRHDTNRGKGAAVRTGLEVARGDIRGFSDADAATDIGELDRVLPLFGSGAQLVIGSRAKSAEGVSVDATLHRHIIGRTFNGLLRFLLDLRAADGNHIADSQCGFKWMTSAAAETLLPHAFVDGFAFDVEWLYLANRLDLPVCEVAINWTDRGASSVNLLRDPLRMAAAAIQVRQRHRHLDGRDLAGVGDKP